MSGLQFEETPLEIETAPEAAQPSIRSHNPMTRDDDGDRVVMVGRADGPGGTGLPDRGGNLTVGTGLSIGDLLKRLPHPPAKRCSRRCEADA